jgi:hypothetical protein
MNNNHASCFAPGQLSMNYDPSAHASNGQSVNIYLRLFNTYDTISVNKFLNFPPVNFTVSLWLKCTVLGPNLPNYAFALWDPVNGAVFQIMWRNFQQISVTMDLNNQIEVDLNPVGVWNHVAVTWQSFDGSTNIYSNGILIGSGTLGKGYAFSNTTALQIGNYASYNDIGKCFRGNIDEVQIAQRVLSLWEISALSQGVYTCFGYMSNSSSVCSSEGQCIATNVCDCNTGYAGPDCSSFACIENDNCSGNGICAGPSQCSCNPGWAGPDCATLTCCKSLYLL